MELNWWDIIFYLVGFAYSILLGGWLIGRTQKTLHRDRNRINEWQPQAVGFVERFLYTATTLADFPVFVGIWLAFKTVSLWERSKTTTESPDKAREIFNEFFIKNGISIAYGLAGAVIIDGLSGHRWLSVAFVAVTLPLAHYLLNWFISKHVRPKTSEPKE